MNKVLVVLSGGADSGTILGKAVEEFGPHNVGAISFDYGQRHIKEIEHARKLSAHYNIRMVVVPITGAFHGSDSKMFTGEVPKESYDDLAKKGGVSPTYVPLRNALMVVNSAVYALIHGYDEVWIGVHRDDGEADLYPDCREDFVGSLGAALFIGSYFKVRLKAPFNYMTKGEIIQLGSKLGVPYRLTWSCYKGGEKHCGVCPTCQARKEAFLQAGAEDPTDYEVMI